MRELKETIGVAPTSSTYKVYLIDEAHMITKDASNAFLKMLRAASTCYFYSCDYRGA